MGKRKTPEGQPTLPGLFEAIRNLISSPEDPQQMSFLSPVTGIENLGRRGPDGKIHGRVQRTAGNSSVEKSDPRVTVTRAETPRGRFNPNKDGLDGKSKASGERDD